MSAFGFSLIFASWLLLALPGVMQRETDDSQHDIYLAGTFNGIGFTVVFFASLEHSLFVLGIFLFAAFAASFWTFGWSLFFSIVAALWLLHWLVDVIRGWNDLYIRSPRA